MFAAVMLVGSAQAGIVTVLTPSIGAPEPGFTGQLSAGVSADRGNVDQTSWRGAAGFVFIDPSVDHELLLTASGDYGSNFGQVTSESAFAHLRYRWGFLDAAPLTWFSFLQSEHNAFQSLLFRNLAGTGLEYRIWRADWTEAWVGTSVMAEHEQLSDGSAPTLVPRSSSFLLLAVQLDKALVLGSSTYFQPNLLDSTDWRLLEELSLSGAFGAHLGWTGGLTFSDDSAPAGAVANTDLSFSSGLTYGW